MPIINTGNRTWKSVWISISGKRKSGEDENNFLESVYRRSPFGSSSPLEAAYAARSLSHDLVLITLRENGVISKA